VTKLRVLRVLPGGVKEREPWPSELEFFRFRPDVAGMAAEDDCVVLNPHSALSAAQREAVALNEAARVIMRRDPTLRPSFSLTPEQDAAFRDYGAFADIRETVAARLLSRDPSALEPTEEQTLFVARLAEAMTTRKT
jgi:hypothetical protein